jgi:hypothetical protein
MQPSKKSPPTPPGSRRPSTSPVTDDENSFDTDNAMQAITAQLPSHPPSDIEDDSYTESVNDLAFERNHTFNKASAKVNSGLSLGLGASYDGDTAFSPFAMNTPILGIDFSAFQVPVQTLPVLPKRKAATSNTTVEVIIRRLLAPPPHAFVHGVLSLNWVIATAGAAEFKNREGDGRFVLSRTSLLNAKGREMGLPGMLWEWMCGGDGDVVQEDMGMGLTREFFEKEV